MPVFVKFLFYPLDRHPQCSLLVGAASAFSSYFYFILSAVLFHAESMERKIIGNSKSADNSPLSSIATDSRVSWRICKIGTINEPVGIMAHWDNHNYSSLHIRH